MHKEMKLEKEISDDIAICPKTWINVLAQLQEDKEFQKWLVEEDDV